MSNFSIPAVNERRAFLIKIYHNLIDYARNFALMPFDIQTGQNIRNAICEIFRENTDKLYDFLYPTQNPTKARVALEQEIVQLHNSFYN